MKFSAATLFAVFANSAVGLRFYVPEIMRPTYHFQTSHVNDPSESGVFACINDHFNPPCERFANPIGECFFVPSDWNDQISAVGPDGGLTCNFYRDYYCRGPVLSDISYCGVEDLRTVGFNDKISSWQCFPDPSKE